MGFWTVVIFASFLPAAPQDPPAFEKPARALPEIVLADAVDPVPLNAFGLGNGGLDATQPRTALRWTPDGCTTPGGIRIQVKSAGLKIDFPSGNELLLAPDGILHLRSGERAGPYGDGIELRLGDDTAVRVRLSQAQRARVRDVVVVHGDRALQPWRRGRKVNEIVRTGFWGGARICCCGGGTELYRAIAIGPLVTLERVLVPGSRVDHTPEQRLVVLTAPMHKSLAMIPRQSRGPNPELRHAVRAVSATSRRSDAIFPSGAGLHRAETDALRWVLRGGYELKLALDGPRAPRLSLFAGRSLRPMVGWVLGVHSSAFLNNPGADQPGANRWSGNGVRMDPIVPELQVRSDLFEHGRAMGLIRRMLGN